MKYKVSDDLKLLSEYLNISLKDLSDRLDISFETLSKIVNNDIYPSNEILEKIYSYFYENKIELNKEKIKIYKEKYNVLLFHGSKEEITGELSLSHSRENVDFGAGFYVGDNYEQSLDFICFNQKGTMYVLNADFSSLKVLKLGVSIEWMLYIALNRGKLEKYKDSKKLIELKNKLNSYDVIIAPIADNRMFTTIDDFTRSAITSEQAMHALKDLSLGDQIVFKSEESLKKLTILEKLYVCKKERLDAYKNKQKKIFDSDDYINNAYEIYIHKGQYISEVFANEKDD